MAGPTGPRSGQNEEATTGDTSADSDDPRQARGPRATFAELWRMRSDSPSERERVPAPLLRTRIPSGRGSMEQPNVTGDGDAPLTLRFWAMLILTAIATGLFGDLLMIVLFSIQHLAFNYHTGSLQDAAIRASAERRVVSLFISGGIAALAWYLLRRYTPGEHTEVDDAIWRGESLSTRRSLGTAFISEVVIGFGASIGREAAPKLMGGVAGNVLGRAARLSEGQRRLLIACGAGSGLACVYNVPLGGALFTVEILLGVITVPTVLPAIACSGLATLTAWIYLPHHATYVHIPQYAFTAPLLLFSLIAGPLIGVLASVYIRLISWVSHHRASGKQLLWAPILACGALGLIGIKYPELFGNGKDMAHMVFDGTGGLALLAALFALKPLVTSAVLQSGISGGLFTPTMSTGALFGGFLGLVWSHAFPGSPMGAYAVLGAAAMIGASMQAPLAALALVLELTHSGFAIMVPMIAATVLATAVARAIDGYSIYSARLGPL